MTEKCKNFIRGRGKVHKVLRGSTCHFTIGMKYYCKWSFSGNAMESLAQIAKDIGREGKVNAVEAPPKHQQLRLCTAWTHDAFGLDRCCTNKHSSRSTQRLKDTPAARGDTDVLLCSILMPELRKLSITAFTSFGVAPYPSPTGHTKGPTLQPQVPHHSHLICSKILGSFNGTSFNGTVHVDDTLYCLQNSAKSLEHPGTRHTNSLKKKEETITQDIALRNSFHVNVSHESSPRYDGHNPLQPSTIPLRWHS